MRKGRIFVVSAPSGCGKTTICKRVLKRVKNLAPSVSATTRRSRRGEKNKKDYYFISRERFKKEIKKGNFLEWEENFGHLYGTPKRPVLKKTREGKNLLLSIDVKGAMQVKKKFPDAIFIFIKPPSLKELSCRLKNRHTDRDAEIKTRLKIAKKELEDASKYNYIAVNDKLENAVNKVVSIINREVKSDLHSPGRSDEG
ncbi:MAG: guanylate kinase [Candidatus Omnitrophota bacterium]